MSEPTPFEHRPTPTVRKCPVCDKPSYSASGIHPQCSLAKADAASRAARKVAEAAAAPAAAPEKASRFQKKCPKCKRAVAPRRFRCDCGHNFEIATAAPVKVGH